MTYRLVLGSLLSLVFALPSACSETPKSSVAAPDAAASPSPDPLTIDGPEAEGFVFRYIDPTTGRATSATSVTAIPEQARAEVVVYQDSAAPPPGWDHVADLRKLPATTQPQQGFSLKVVRVAPSKATAAKKGAVVMFVRDGCGFCTKADRWLTAKKVPFEKLNLDHDPSAQKRLVALAKKAGMSQSQLRGVPVIFVGGRAIVGFDKARLAKMLGV